MPGHSQNLKCDNFKNLVKIISDVVDNRVKSSNIDEIYSRIEIEIPPVDLLDWLYNQNSDKKIYWSDKNNKFEISAIGAKDIIKSNNPKQKRELITSLINNIKRSDKRIRYFGGFKFDSSQSLSDNWEMFGDFLFILPRFEIIRRENNFYFACNIDNNNKLSKNKLLNELKEFSFSQKEKSEFKNKVLSRKDNPDKAGWHGNIEKAKDKISSTEIEKIVLSRQTVLICKDNINPEFLLKELKSKSNNCYHFLLELDHSFAFLGATPEKLFTRIGENIECEAIAGTTRRSDNEAEDEQLGMFLINNQKDLTEHHFVVKSIYEALSGLIDEEKDNKTPDVTILKLSKLQHLISRFKYNLQDHVSDYDLYERLHPTAAVGGYPKKQALREIAEIENFDRGWYAAPIGWIGDESTELVVGIRSALINNNCLLLYSGAGIIESSDADSEYEEIENKLSNFLNILT
jgi:menaquinone-specific isochorismate synthase